MTDDEKMAFVHQLYATTGAGTRCGIELVHKSHLLVIGHRLTPPSLWLSVSL